jgi:hypothetical protein
MNKLLIVTDLGLLRAYKLATTPKGTPRLELAEEVIFKDAHQRVIERVSDLSGQRACPARTAWGTPLSDVHNLKLELKRRLIKQIAGRIQRLMEARAGDGVWLAAPREINHLILDRLPRALRPRLEVNLARDLARVDKRELIKSFPPLEMGPVQPPSAAVVAKRSLPRFKKGI